jgi:purine-cytosine permease-like protein
MLTIVGAVAYVIVALILQTNFSHNLENFLLVIAYWLGAWNAIILIEHRMRKGKYPVEDYQTASKLPVGIAAVVSMLVGLAIAALGVSQTIFTGPLAGLLHDSFMDSQKMSPADIGFPLAIVTAGVLYYFLRRWELARYKR